MTASARSAQTLIEVRHQYLRNFASTVSMNLTTLERYCLEGLERSSR